MNNVVLFCNKCTMTMHRFSKNSQESYLILQISIRTKGKVVIIHSKPIIKWKLKYIRKKSDFYFLRDCNQTI